MNTTTHTHVSRATVYARGRTAANAMRNAIREDRAWHRRAGFVVMPTTKALNAEPVWRDKGGWKVRVGRTYREAAK